MTYNNIKKPVVTNYLTYRNGVILFAYVLQPSLVIAIFVKIVI